MSEQNTQAPEDDSVVSTSSDAKVEPVSLAAHSENANDSALTPTARAIQATLNAASAQSPTDVFVALSRLTTRQLPPNIFTQELEPKHQPRCCCFDLSSAMPSWTALSVCARCMLLYQLMRGCASVESAVAVQALVGISILITDCVSQRNVTGSIPSLPIELLHMVIEYAVEDMRWTRDGAAVAKLLHVSSSIRYKVVQNFEEIMLYEDVAQHHYEALGTPESLLVHRDVVVAVWEAMREYWRDVSIRRHDNRVKSRPESNSYMMTKIGELFRDFSCEVRVKTAVREGEHVNSDKQESMCKSIDFQSRPRHAVRVSDVQDALLTVISHRDIQDVPYLASPHYRAARLGKFGGTDAQVYFKVKLSFTHHSVVNKQVVGWSFTNFPYED